MIFVALAVVWAVVLIPKALRHHDEVAKTRSVDQVSDTVRVLARREAVSHREGRLVLGPRATPAVPAPRTSGEPAPASRPAAEPLIPGQRRPTARLQARRAAAARAARRRRRVLAVLLLADLAVVVAAVLGAAPVWSVSIPVAVTLGFLLLARVLVRREHAAWDRERAALRVMTVEEPEVAADDEAPETTRNEQGLEVVSDSEDTSSFSVEELREAVGAPSTSLWDPLPVTLPTYVTKPRAHRSVRTIDLTDPRIVSSGHDPADSALAAESATAQQPEDAVDPTTTRWAAGS